MSLLDRFISVVAPFDCLCCGREGQLLCNACTENLETIPSRCYRCHKLTKQSRTCNSCRRVSKLHSVRPITSYQTSAKRLIGRLKFYGARAAAVEMARIMRQEDLPDNYVVVPVPTATKRVRVRGYDQAKLIARSFAKQRGLPYLDCLARSGQSHQVGAGRQQRRKQLDGAYRIKTGLSVAGLNLILIDDVLTTGATLESAALCLKSDGAKRVAARVFCQA